MTVATVAGLVSRAKLWTHWLRHLGPSLLWPAGDRQIAADALLDVPGELTTGQLQALAVLAKELADDANIIQLAPADPRATFWLSPPAKTEGRSLHVIWPDDVDKSPSLSAAFERWHRQVIRKRCLQKVSISSLSVLRERSEPLPASLIILAGGLYGDSQVADLSGLLAPTAGLLIVSPSTATSDSVPPAHDSVARALGLARLTHGSREALWISQVVESEEDEDDE